MGLRGDTTAGCIGPPAACSEIKLVDVPEMNYLTSDHPNPRGELCVRGPNVFVGYYKQKAKTEEVWSFFFFSFPFCYFNLKIASSYLLIRFTGA